MCQSNYWLTSSVCGTLCLQRGGEKDELFLLHSRITANQVHHLKTTNLISHLSITNSRNIAGENSRQSKVRPTGAQQCIHPANRPGWTGSSIGKGFSLSLCLFVSVALAFSLWYWLFFSFGMFVSALLFFFFLPLSYSFSFSPLLFLSTSPATPPHFHSLAQSLIFLWIYIYIYLCIYITVYTCVNVYLHTCRYTRRFLLMIFRLQRTSQTILLRMRVSIKEYFNQERREIIIFYF